MTLESVITTAGKEASLNMTFGDSVTAMTFMAVSTSRTGTLLPSATQLAAEPTIGVNGYARVDMSTGAPNSITYASGGSKTVILEAVFDDTNITNSVTLQEIGIFDASSAGTPWCICQVPDTPKTSSTTVKFTITAAVV